MNLALPAGTGDEGWLRAFHAVVPELLAGFHPQVLVTQHGADTHFEDPLGASGGVVGRAAGGADRLPRAGARVRRGGRWVALGGGGYAVVDVVPRSWTHLVAIAAPRRDRTRVGDPRLLARRGVRRTGSRRPAG